MDKYKITTNPERIYVSTAVSTEKSVRVHSNRTIVLVDPVVIPIYFEQPRYCRVKNIFYIQLKTKPLSFLNTTNIPTEEEMIFKVKVEGSEELEYFQIKVTYISPKTDNSIIECSVCNFEFDEDRNVPRFLGCGHTFCQSCLEQLKTSLGQDRTEIKCPIDRSITGAPPISLPKNRVVLDAIREKQEKETSKRRTFVGDPVHPCYEDPTHEATRYCTQCEQGFCSDCHDKSHSAKIFQWHKHCPIEEKATVPSKCSEHPSRIAEFICHNGKCKHKNVIFCEECSTTGKHSKHPYAKMSDKYASNYEYLNYSDRRLALMKIGLQDQYDDLDKCFDSFSPQHPTFVSAVERIEKEFEEQKKAAIGKLHSFGESRQKEVLNARESIRQRLHVVCESQKEVRRKLKRKLEMHDITEIRKTNQTLFSMNNPRLKYFEHFGDFKVTNDMSVEPVFHQYTQPPSRCWETMQDHIKSIGDPPAQEIKTTLKRSFTDLLKEEVKE